MHHVIELLCKPTLGIDVFCTNKLEVCVDECLFVYPPENMAMLAAVLFRRVLWKCYKPWPANPTVTILYFKTTESFMRFNTSNQWSVSGSFDAACYTSALIVLFCLFVF